MRDSASPRLVSGLQVAQLSQSDSNHMDSTSQRNLLGRTSQLVLNSCFSCSTNSDIDGVRIFSLASKITVKDHLYPISLFFCLEYMVGEKRILVYLRLNR